MKRISSYDELGRIRDQLDEAAANGTLTAELLGEAVDTIDDAGYETIPSSVGMDWIWRNSKALAENISDVPGFFRAHLDNSYITGAIHSEELLRLIPEEEREQFVREVLFRHTPANNGWVEAAINAGVSREAVAEMVLEKLRRSQVISGVWTFIEHDFLEYGAGRVERASSLRDFLQHRLAPGEAERIAGEMQQTPGVERVGTSLAAGMSLLDDDPWQWRFAEEPTLWSVLDDEQFVEALRICIGKSPNLLFSGRRVNETITLTQKLRMRLSPEQLEAVLMEAAGKLESLDGVNLDELDRLSPTVQLEIARRTGGGSLDFVVRLALMLGFKNCGYELCEEFSEQFASGHSATNYRRLWGKLQKAEHKVMASHIEERLLKRLEADGYVLGQATEGKYFNRKLGRECSQMQVRDERETYVQDRYQHRYHPAEGDWVLFDKRGHQLTPRVVSVIFIPAHSMREYM